jgi:hypothetical protein
MKGEWMYAACKPTQNEWVETMNNLGIDVGKKKCRAALKDERHVHNILTLFL